MRSHAAKRMESIINNDGVTRGLTVENLTAELARQLEADRGKRGVVVTDIDPSSVAARAGIRSGDMIVAIGGKASVRLRAIWDSASPFPTA